MCSTRLEAVVFLFLTSSLAFHQELSPAHALIYDLQNEQHAILGQAQ